MVNQIKLLVGSKWIIIDLKTMHIKFIAIYKLTHGINIQIWDRKFDAYYIWLIIGFII